MDTNTKKIAFVGLSGFAIGFLFTFGIFSFQNANELKAQLTSYQNQYHKAAPPADVVLLSDDEMDSSGALNVHEVKREDIKSLARYIWKKCKSDDSSDETAEECMQRHFDAIKKQQKEEKDEIETNKWNAYDSEEAEQKREQLQQKAEEKREIYLLCREESGSVEELQECIRKKLGNEDPSAKSDDPQELPKKPFPAPKKRDLKELVRECLDTAPQNLRECIKNALQDDTHEEGANDGSENNTNSMPKKGESYYLPGQLPPVQSDDITNPTI